MYKKLFRPILFSFRPEFIHNFSFLSIKILFKIPFIKFLSKKLFQLHDKNLEINIIGKTFKNRIGLAAGFDKNAELLHEMEYFGFSPFFASFIALSEVLAGLMLIISFFLKSFIGNLLTRVSALTIVVIMIFAFYLAHKDWFINEKLFTSEQIFLFVVGIYFLVNGNEDFKKKVFKN